MKNSQTTVTTAVLGLMGVIVISALSGCFHKIEPVEAVINHPPLSLQADFDALKVESAPITLDIDSSKKILSDVLYRYMNAVELANQSIDRVADTNYAPPIKYKTAARAVYVEDASIDSCVSVDGMDKAIEALIWDDKDNSQNASAGDIWHYQITNCFIKSSSSIATGMISQTGMDQEFLPDSELASTFSNYAYVVNMQIDGQTGKVAYIKNAKMNFDRVLDSDSEEITSLNILNGTMMGVAKTDSVTEDTELFLFDFSKSSLKNDDGLLTLEASFTARYYDTEIGGYVDVATTEPLIFEYTFKDGYESISTSQPDFYENNVYQTIDLTAGTLTITSENESASLKFHDATTVVTEFNGESGTDDIVDQTVYFRTEFDEANPDLYTFSLVNISK